MVESTPEPKQFHLGLEPTHEPTGIILERTGVDLAGAVLEPTAVVLETTSPALNPQTLF